MSVASSPDSWPAWLAVLASLLPVIGGLELLALARSRARDFWLDDWRESLLSAAVLWGVLVTLSSELLSAFDQLTTIGVGLFWLAAIGAGGVVLARGGRRIAPPPWKHLAVPDRTTVGVLGALMLISLLVGVTAVASPPNNWDGLSYHMSRVVHWAADQSLADYPTNFLPQLYLGPWPELAILQSMLLSGSDRLSNIYGWASFVGCGLGASLVARRLGAGRPGQILAATVAMTAPMAIMQGSNVQDDIGAAFCLLAFVALLLGLRISPGGNVPRGALLLIGAALGLAVLTKATAYLYAAPFVVWLGLRLPRRGLLAAAVFIGVPVLVINAGQYARNVELFESPLGPAGPATGYRHLNDVFTPATFVSNLVRNTALHLGTPSPQINQAEESAIRTGLGWLGIDPDDPATTWPQARFAVPRLVGDEDQDGNPIHLVLLLLAIAVGVRYARGDLRAYAAATAAGYLLFCFLLRWQPWHSRLHLPLFELWAPFIGVVLARWLPRPLAPALAGLLIVAAMPWVVYTQSRPLVGPRSVLLLGRTDQYFQNAPSMRADYLDAVDTLAARDCKAVGLVSGPGDLEYPLWPLLDARLGPSVRLEHVGVENESARLPIPLGKSGFAPCGLLVLADRPDWETQDQVELDGQTWETISESPSLNVLVPVRQAARYP